MGRAARDSRCNPALSWWAKRTGAPILPMAFGAQWKRVLASWDAFLLPLPFSRVVVVYGEPIYVPADASAADLEAKRREVEASLRRITETADALLHSLNVSPLYPCPHRRRHCLAAVPSVALPGAVRPTCRTCLNASAAFPSRMEICMGACGFTPPPWARCRACSRSSLPCAVVFRLNPWCSPRLPPAGKALAQNVIPQAERVFLLPFDLPWIVGKVARRLRPGALIVQETELWPNLFRELGQMHVPIVLVNGRLSPRSFRRYARVRPFMRRVLSDVSLVLAQSDRSAQRFQHLGVPAHRVRMVGNTNIDRALSQAGQPIPPHPMAPLLADRRVLVAGSTHEGEEGILLSVYQRLRVRHPDLCLVLAPRHLERVETVARHVQACSLSVVRRSRYPGEASESRPDVVILDTLGELVAFYKLCTVAFVGGSLAPIGGHNILEPVMFAKPPDVRSARAPFPGIGGPVTQRRRGRPGAR